MKSLSLTECGIELSTTSDEAAKLFDATVAQTVLMDTDKQGSCSVLVLPIVYLDSFERWAQLKMVHTSNDHLQIGGIGKSSKKMMEADPDFLMGKVFLLVSEIVSWTYMSLT